MTLLSRLMTWRETAGQGNVRARAHHAVLSDAQRRMWHENGFLVLPRHFSTAVTDEVNRLVDDLWATAERNGTSTVVDIFVDTPQERRMRLSAAPRAARCQPYKLNDLYLEIEAIRHVALEPGLSAVVEELIDGQPLVCNTLNLEYGSQQDFHTDSLYMAAPVGQHLVASWIALEHAKPEAGLLQYYVGSHHIPPYLFSRGTTHAVAEEMPQYRAYMTAEVARRGLVLEQFHARSGDVLLWHSQLYHGGDRIRDATCTRRSMVTHYWRACDLPGPHAELGGGRYYLARAPQPVP
jgi:ectoine hydroxylase-related dioxygenase (phytanoyl-CoA dioxygenase family)